MVLCRCCPWFPCCVVDVVRVIDVARGFCVVVWKLRCFKGMVCVVSIVSASHTYDDATKKIAQQLGASAQTPRVQNSKKVQRAKTKQLPASAEPAAA